MLNSDNIVTIEYIQSVSYSHFLSYDFLLMLLLGFNKTKKQQHPCAHVKI